MEKLSSSFTSSDDDLYEQNNPFRESLSSILFACAGDVEQYEETINALQDAVVCYLRHLAEESIKVAKNPHSIRANDIIDALKDYPRIQKRVKTFLSEKRSFEKEKRSFSNFMSLK